MRKVGNQRTLPTLHDYMTYGKGIRIYYGKEEDTIILLLLGGDKSTQNRDVKKAIEYWHEQTGE